VVVGSPRGKGPPRGADPHPTPIPGESSITLPIELPLADLQASIDRSIPQVLA
jgi:hypothetical protein